jgi:hypothetical protein
MKYEDKVPGPISTQADPWAHRSKRMRCYTCMWWLEKRREIPATTLGSEKVGRCRRHAPTFAGWPITMSGDWCGDHRLDENAS